MWSDPSGHARLESACATATASFYPVVAVPAKNEQERLPSLIRSLATQAWLAGGERQLDVVIVLNNTSDGSRQAIEETALGTPLRIHLVETILPDAFAHVGTARRLSLELASNLCPVLAAAVLLMTDADAVPSPDWIDANLVAIGHGADLVGGRVVGNRREESLLGRAFVTRARRYMAYAELCDRLESLIDPIPHDRWPRHRDHTGASLAVRADVYHQVGGLPPLPRREDLAFVARVKEAGFRLRHDPAVTVGVSARTQGRAQGGMADTLAQWFVDAEAGCPHLVEAPEAVLERAMRRRLLRETGTCEPERIAIIASRLGLLPAEFHDAEGAVLPPEVLVQRHAPDEPDTLATIDVSAATLQLKAMIAESERTADAA